MKKYSILIVLLILSCSIEQKNFELSGKIDGLNSEKIYLLESNSIILDSTKIDDSSSFTLKCYIEEPQILTLRLGKSDTNQANFFAETGTMTLSTTSKRFQFDAQFSGSKQQSNLDEFNSYLIKFEEEDLDLLETQIQQSIIGNQKEIDSISILREKLEKRKNLFIVNYILNNSKEIISPYLALKYNKEIKSNYLTKIYNSYNKEISESKYGIELKKILKK
jgi:hypothetical protein